ncbi:MAG: hypothetical protein ACI4XJ_10410 [Eubacteriales bacterium]
MTDVNLNSAIKLLDSQEEEKILTYLKSEWHYFSAKEKLIMLGKVEAIKDLKEIYEIKEKEKEVKPD